MVLPGDLCVVPPHLRARAQPQQQSHPLRPRNSLCRLAQRVPDSIVPPKGLAVLAVEKVAHGVDVRGVCVGKELKVSIVIGLTTGVVDAELGGKLVEDVYYGNDGVRPEVDVRLGGRDSLGSGGEIRRYAKIALGARR